ncbi:hypothetical protein AMJ39_04720 [candidate division TA06 bacterium DG_24]|uniref:Uncharacterized protein n=3 Tax=Bacteria division TA06 TaxID=1156500 RepID=A0A0S8JBQ4_UNCT6|nr:MAG: hypothetical protein AMJ39_04720 [candidate division TA06 bacterium DG_24]KPK71530.1 MAG: hypothetical protein AMJ82_00795 [candidate division TA06 bacterium SM23_40]KPL06771.1 MAG: hypothetical protein AMJ71_09340 [candidate division TA06 bacterium SM1_40]
MVKSKFSLTLERRWSIVTAAIIGCVERVQILLMEGSMGDETRPSSEAGGPRLVLDLNLETASTHPARIAESIARAFYRELRRHQFDDNQIIRVASELIGCLTHSLDGYKRKVEQKEEEEEEGER